MAAAKIKVQGPEDEANEEKAPETGAAPEAAETQAAESAAEAEADEPASTDAGEAPAEDTPAEEAPAEAPEVDEAAVAAEADAIVDGAAEEAAKAEEDVAAKLADVLAQAKKDAADAKDKYLRLQAEWDNFRKRTASERESEKQRATEKLVKDLLPVIDDFERAIAHAKTNPDVATLTEGVEAVHSKFLSVLEKSHVVQISPEGEPFDANRHQAVGTKEDAEAYDETCVQVYQCGYEMGGHVIRPAMVVVSTGGPKRPPEEDEGTSEE